MHRWLCSLLPVLLLLATTAAAQQTAFTYQGQLAVSGSPANGTWDFRFTLYDSAADGMVLGGPVAVDAVPVQAGLFVAPMDFGGAPFDGGPLFLDIAVRASGSGDPFVVLEPRQPLTAAPYAIHAWQVAEAAVGPAQIVPGAVAAAQVDANAIQLRVTRACSVGSAIRGIDKRGDVTCEADDAGIVSVVAGAGLTGGGSGAASVSVAVDTAVVQQRVSGTCAVGSSIRAIAADGSVECSVPAAVPQAFFGHTQRQLASGSRTSGELDAALDAYGQPLVVFHDDVDGDLKLIRCLDVLCDQFEQQTLDEAGITGRWPSIVLRSDGRPAIAYYDQSNGDLRLIDCADPACTAFTRVSVDASGDVGQEPAMVAVHGTVLIAYHDAGNADLKLAYCSSSVVPACDEPVVQVVDSDGAVGLHPAIARSGSSTTEVWIAYRDAGANTLKFARCNNLSCDAVRTLFGPDADAEIARDLAIAIGPDNRPLIAHVRVNASGSGNVRITHCGSSSCSSSTTLAHNVTSGGMRHTDLVVGSDGFPLLLLGATPNRCGAADCSGTFASGSGGSSSARGSVLIGSDGRPGIVVFHPLFSTLIYTHCTNAWCSGNGQR